MNIKRYLYTIYLQRGYQSYYDYHACYGWGTTIGFTIGHKIKVGKMRLDPFFTIGATCAKLQRTTYSSTSKNHEAREYPYRSTFVWLYATVNSGLKIGFEFKKTRKGLHIDSRFDSVHLPQRSKLQSSIETINFKRSANLKQLKRAEAKLKRANKILTKIYTKTYHDTTMMYNEIEKFYNGIEIVIEAEKK